MARLKPMVHPGFEGLSSAEMDKALKAERKRLLDEENARYSSDPPIGELTRQERRRIDRQGAEEQATLWRQWFNDPERKAALKAWYGSADFHAGRPSSAETWEDFKARHTGQQQAPITVLNAAGTPCVFPTLASLPAPPEGFGYEWLTRVGPGEERPTARLVRLVRRAAGADGE